MSTRRRPAPGTALPSEPATRKVAAEFPKRCGQCGALRINGAWRDPITHRDYSATVRHDGTCAVYRERRYDRAEPVAHLLALGGVRS